MPTEAPAEDYGSLTAPIPVTGSPPTACLRAGQAAFATVALLGVVAVFSSDSSLFHPSAAINAGFRSYSTEGKSRRQEFRKGKNNNRIRETTFYNVENDAMFDNMDMEHIQEHNNYHTYDASGHYSKGVVTLEGTWTAKQLAQFENMSIEEQHEFYRHYNQREARHDRGEATVGGGGRDDGSPRSSSPFCEPNPNLRRCFIKTEVQCAEQASQCIWVVSDDNGPLENPECMPRDPDVCFNPPEGSDEEACPDDCADGEGGCDEECFCKKAPLCVWRQAHTRNRPGFSEGTGVDSRIHVGGASSENGPKGYRTKKTHKLSRVCDMCEYFGVDGDCDASNFVPKVREQGLVEGGNAGTCQATLRTGEKCFIGCSRGYVYTSPVYCKHRNGGTAAGPQEMPQCIGRPCDVEAPPNGNMGNCPAELEHGGNCYPGCDEGYHLVGAGGGAISCNLGKLQRPSCEEFSIEN